MNTLKNKKLLKFTEDLQNYAVVYVIVHKGVKHLRRILYVQDTFVI